MVHRGCLSGDFGRYKAICRKCVPLLRVRPGTAIVDYELLVKSARRAPERTDELAWTVMSAFTDHLRDVTLFRKFEREKLLLVTEAQRK